MPIFGVPDFLLAVRVIRGWDMGGQVERLVDKAVEVWRTGYGDNLDLRGVMVGSFRVRMGLTPAFRV